MVQVVASVHVVVTPQRSATGKKDLPFLNSKVSQQGLSQSNSVSMLALRD